MSRTAILTREDSDMSTTYDRVPIALPRRHEPAPAATTTTRRVGRRTRRARSRWAADNGTPEPSGRAGAWADPMPMDIAMLLLRSR